jgi:hypothetical protein
LSDIVILLLVIGAAVAVVGLAYWLWRKGGSKGDTDSDGEQS